MSEPRFRLAGTVLNTRDVQSLAGFYERLLGWPRLMDEDGWVVLRERPDATALAFHEDVEYVPPTWPSVPGEQQIMLHLDLATDDLDAATVHALDCGAVLAGHQPATDERVLLDPDGHPFCLIATADWS